VRLRNQSRFFYYRQLTLLPLFPALASGAIAAVMGAFHITFPYGRIHTVVFLGWFVTVSFIPIASARLFESRKKLVNMRE
jgi:hypothetical protein